MKTSKVVTIVVIAVAMIFVMGACSLVDNLATFKENQNEENQQPQDKQTADDPNQDQNKDDNNTVEKGLDISAMEPADTDPKDDEQQQDSATGDTKEVVLYFTASDGESLESEKRNIPKQEGLARATINELISGPKSQSLSPTLPASTILEDINIAEGVCTVDFSSDLLTDLSDDQTAQKLALYSIVNTLTQFDTVDYVKILVNGQAIETLAGVDASTVIAPMYNW